MRQIQLHSFIKNQVEVHNTGYSFQIFFLLPPEAAGWE